MPEQPVFCTKRPNLAGTVATREIVLGKMAEVAYRGLFFDSSGLSVRCQTTGRQGTP
jgi:hypothetical protein